MYSNRTSSPSPQRMDSGCAATMVKAKRVSLDLYYGDDVAVGSRVGRAG